MYGSGHQEPEAMAVASAVPRRAKASNPNAEYLKTQKGKKWYHDDDDDDGIKTSSGGDLKSGKHFDAAQDLYQAVAGGVAASKAVHERLPAKNFVPQNQANQADREAVFANLEYAEAVEVLQAAPWKRVSGAPDHTVEAIDSYVDYKKARKIKHEGSDQHHKQVAAAEQAAFEARLDFEVLRAQAQLAGNVPVPEAERVRDLPHDSHEHSGRNTETKEEYLRRKLREKQEQEFVDHFAAKKVKNALKGKLVNGGLQKPRAGWKNLNPRFD